MGTRCCASVKWRAGALVRIFADLHADKTCIFPLPRAAASLIEPQSARPGVPGFARVQFIHQVPGDPESNVRGSLVFWERKRRMDAAELKEKSPEQLREQLLALKKEQFNLRFQAATGQLENPARIRVVRRDVARVKTVLNEKAAQAAAD